MTKKYIYILFSLLLIILIVISDNKMKTTDVFNETYNDYDFNIYNLKFNECDLNTDNFIDNFTYFKDKDFRLLEIEPYINESYKNLFIDKKFLFYSDDLTDILNKFKNDYLDIMLNNSIYITNVCIKSIRIDTANIYINEFRSEINFTY